MDGKVKPRGSLVLVEELPPEDVTTTGGIVLSGAVTNAGVTYAMVKEVGPGRLMDTGKLFDMSDLHPGDFVMIQSKQMMPLVADNLKCGIINENNILAVIER